MIIGFKETCALLLCRGALLKDSQAILIRPTENTQAARQIRFTRLQDIIDMETVLKAYIHEAIEAEKAGLKVSYKKITEFQIPEEFQTQLDRTFALKKAFESLTLGRQRAYLLHFSAPKQSKTRAARVEKHRQKILEGKGLMDEYKSRKK